jgi:hypothetical protein
MPFIPPKASATAKTKAKWSLDQSTMLSPLTLTKEERKEKDKESFHLCCNYVCFNLPRILRNSLKADTYMANLCIPNNGCLINARWINCQWDSELSVQYHTGHITRLKYQGPLAFSFTWCQSMIVSHSPRFLFYFIFVVHVAEVGFKLEIFLNFL